MDKQTTLDQLKEQIQTFCQERDWDQFHSAKDLAIGAVTESSELLEHFRFLTVSQVEQVMGEEDKRQEVSDELADVLFFILRFAQRYEIDLASAFADKMERNGQRYPASEFRGKNHKAEAN